MQTTKEQMSLCLISAFVVHCLDNTVHVSVLAKSKMSRLACLCSGVGWFESTLVANPEYRFFD